MLGRLLRTLLASRKAGDRGADRIDNSGDDPLRVAAAAAELLHGREAMHAGNHVAALSHFSAALQRLDEKDRNVRPDVLANRGLCHAILGKLAAAEEDFSALLALSPPHSPQAAMAHMNLGNIALGGHRFTEATGHYEAALDEHRGRNATHADLLNNIGISLFRRGLPERAIERYRQALAIRPDYQDAATNLLFAMQHSPEVSPQQLFDAFRDWARRHEAPLLHERQPHANDPDPARRLRIGYVSGDFFRHAVANFIEPVLQCHDRSAVEVFCYVANAHSDERTAVLRGLADHWREVAGLSDAQLAQRVRDDAIDILVDLSAHTVGHRLLAFARKPAPVQMTWLGYPTTTGLQSIDYRISDAVSDPPGVADAFHSERILRLPRVQWCYRPDAQAPPVRELPALLAGRITFGSFNNLAKLNDAVLQLWARVLMALPEARINVVSIPDIPSRHRVADALIAHGAQPAQVKITGTLEYAEFWRIRDDIDIVLDAFPYNGTTTTCEALWAGLPVVTLAGSHGASRSAASILTSVGLGGLVAHDAAAYVSIAQSLAADVAKLAGMRRGMRQRLIEAGLCDGPRFAGELESLYREAWRNWCEGRTAPTQ